MRTVYPRSKKWQAAGSVSSATVAAVQAAGFDVIADPTPNFPNHARLIHPLGASGFTDENLAALAAVLTEVVV
jgi:pyridoxal/pyridoxine/pyridoxamine kinase